MQQTAQRDTYKGVALALLCIAEFVNVLGVTVVIVALPSIGKSLGLTGTDLQWVASAYALVFGSFLLLAGRAADLYGRRLFFMVGLAVFVGASLVCGLAGTLPVLVAARAVQGLGAALVLPAALSTLATIFPEGSQRNRAVGIWTAVAAGGGAAGFFLGGVISESLSWRWVFLLNIPVGIVGIALAPLFLPESRDRRGSRQLDVAGAVCVTLVLFLLIYGFTQAEAAGFALRTLSVFGIALLALSAFFIVEAHVTRPLISPGVWRMGNLTGSSLVAFVLTASSSAGAVVGTLYLQNVLGYSASNTGLAYAPGSVAVVAGSLIGSSLIGRAGRRTTMITGLALVSLAMLISSQISAEGGFAFLLTGIIVSGLGLGCASVASTATGVSAVSEEEGGLASGLLNAAAQVGTALGIAALVSISAVRTNSVSASSPSAAALVEGYQLAYVVAAGIALAGVLAVIYLVRSAQEPFKK